MKRAFWKTHVLETNINKSINITQLKTCHTKRINLFTKNQCQTWATTGCQAKNNVKDVRSVSRMLMQT